MSQSFSVNGKEYLQSNALAVSLGYTPDYIGKLAREEKILGTLIGRQWFIEPESLKTYLQKASVEKEILNEDLSAKRKIERKVQEHKKARVESLHHADFIALSQSLAILICGLLLGGLGFVISFENIGVSEITEGARENVSYIAESFSPLWITNSLQDNRELSVAASAEGISLVSYAPRFEVFTVLPQFPPRVALASTSDDGARVQVQDTVTLQFSDEVKIVVDDEGATFIEPVFKKESTTTSRFVLTPVKEPAN